MVQGWGCWDRNGVGVRNKVHAPPPPVGPLWDLGCIAEPWASFGLGT